MASEISERQSTRGDRWFWLVGCIVLGTAVSIGGSILIGLFIELNRSLLSSIPWFLIAVALAIGIAMSQSHSLDPPMGSQRLSASRAALFSVIVGISLGLIAAELTGIHNISSGNALLPGEKSHATLGFQISATLVTLVAAGVFEELGTRGFIQFRLARHWHPHICEAVAGLVFVVLHFPRFHVPGQLMFACLLGLICGRAAAMTNRILWPMCIHVGANLTVMTLVWLGRL